MNNPTFVWNQETESLLRTLWEAGVSSSVIATTLNTTKNSVLGKVHRLGLAKRGNPVGKGKRKEKKTSTGAAKVAARRIDVPRIPPKPQPTPAIAPAPRQPTAPAPPRPVVHRFYIHKTCCYPMWKSSEKKPPRPPKFCDKPVFVRNGKIYPYCLEHAMVCYSTMSMTGTDEP